MNRAQRRLEARRVTAARFVPGPDRDALMLEGLAHQHAGRFDRAADVYQGVLRRWPNDADALHLLGATTLDGGGDPEEAVRLIERAAALDLGASHIRANLGRAHIAVALRHERQRDYPSAEVAWQRAERACVGAARLIPRDAELHVNLSMVLHRLGRVKEAEAASRRALMLDPGLAMAHHNLASLLAVQGRHEEAIVSWRRALSLGLPPAEAVTAHAHLGYALLTLGRFEEGWATHELRTGAPPGGWDGAPLAGRDILLVDEEGFGDEIQMVRYAPLVAARGGRVTLVTRPELARLFGTVSRVDRVATRATPRHLLPALGAATMSLPYLFKTSLETIPAEVPYLHADPVSAARRRAEMEALGPDLRVGLVWATGDKGPLDNAAPRTLGLAALAPLGTVPNVRFFALQRSTPGHIRPDRPAPESEVAPAGMEIARFDPAFEDFADTAAVIANLDLVISVDTAVAHLAGALGKPVWILLPSVPDWRWLLGREDSPWYPTARLFRQQCPNEWGAVVARVADELAKLAAGRSAA